MGNEEASLYNETIPFFVEENNAVHVFWNCNYKQEIDVFYKPFWVCNFS